MNKLTTWITKNPLAIILILAGVALLIVMIIFGKIGGGIGGVILAVYGWLNKKDERKIEKLQKDRADTTVKINESKQRQEKIIKEIKESADDKAKADEKIADIQKQRDSLKDMSNEEYIKFLKTL